MIFSSSSRERLKMHQKCLKVPESAQKFIKSTPNQQVAVGVFRADEALWSPDSGGSSLDEVAPLFEQIHCDRFAVK